jgi:predicted RNase H-like HicB family nuclease
MSNAIVTKGMARHVVDGEFCPSPALLKRARAVMSAYTLVIGPKEGGGYVGSTKELPGVIVSAPTLAECVRRLDFGLETVLATYLADGQPPPCPAGREKRTEQVNVRFTPSERDLLDRESARQGFRGVGDLIRAEMIRRVGSGWR